MSGNKTHQQQRQIIEKRVDTRNESKDFDPRSYLDAPRHSRDHITERPLPGDPTPLASGSGNPSPQGENQESQHNKS